MAERAPALPRPDGPAVVAIGGGHGLSASLRAVRRYAGTITAVVSVADDGGSTGRLRAAMPDLPAPGDVRKCLGALADEAEPFAAILEHRYDDGDLAGHTLGNLLLVSLAAELGSFSGAVAELAERVGAVGRVLPATVGPVELEGVLGGAEGARVVGQVAVQNASGVRRLALHPPDPASDPSIATAIAAADQVVLGPGSLFTSVLAAAVVPAVQGALASTGAQRVYVANLAPQVPETEGFTVADEVAALREHAIAPDLVLVDPRRGVADEVLGTPVAVHPVAQRERAVHDPELLAAALEAVGAPSFR